MKYKIQNDTLGEIKIPANKLWGAQSARSLQNFNIGEEIFPHEFILSYAYLKKCCAIANFHSNKLSDEKKDLIISVCDEIIKGKLKTHFPLRIWQTGSGTQTNMNLNEVIANKAALLNNEIQLHPNDDVNMSQSSNDTFPSAMRIAVLKTVTSSLLPSLDTIIESFNEKKDEFEGIVKVGRTHLQDAVPLFFTDEINAYISMLEESRSHIEDSLKYLKKLPIGGTAVGNGLNAPKGFDKMVCNELNKFLGLGFVPSSDKFHGLSSHDAEVFLSGALNSLASNLMKIANDIRWLSSGPKCSIGEITIGTNEPGSSIMPAKVNPTQAEALSMVCVQVMGNHTTISLSASQGNFELNVFKPVIIYNLLQSIRLLSDSMESFALKCVDTIKPNGEKIKEYLNSSLMSVTALNPHIGYDNSAKIAKFAYEKGISLKEAAKELGILDEKMYDELIDLKKIALGNRI